MESAVKRSLFEELAPPQAQKGNFLQNLPQRQQVVLKAAAIIALQYSGYRLIHRGSPYHGAAADRRALSIAGF